MDFAIVDKLRNKLNLETKSRACKGTIRRKPQDQKPQHFLTLYQELIQQEKQSISRNKYAQAMAQSAARHHPTVETGSASPKPKTKVLDQSLVAMKRQLQVMTRQQGRKRRWCLNSRKKQQRNRAVDDGMLSLENTSSKFLDLRPPALPELTATRCGRLKLIDPSKQSILSVFNNQMIRNLGSQAFPPMTAQTFCKSIDTQTPEPPSTDTYSTMRQSFDLENSSLELKETMKPLPVYRLKNQTMIVPHVRAFSAQDYCDHPEIVGGDLEKRVRRRIRIDI